MQDLDFSSSDLGETEHFLAGAYAKMRIGGDGTRSNARVQRRWLGPVSIDDLCFDYEMSYDADPLDRIVLCRIHSGRIEEAFLGEPQDVFAPGDLTLFSPPELPFSGKVCQAGYDVTGFDPTLLSRVAATAPTGRRTPVRLTGHRPVSGLAAGRLSALIDYLREHVLTDPGAIASPLIVATAAAHLATATLNAFPNNALIDPTATDRRDASRHPLMKRAVGYIDANAHTDIAVADIAEHAGVTPSGLRYMFDLHLDCTPTDYIRRVRLHHAHRDLVDADPTTDSVPRIAQRWGFSHIGRFVVSYRQEYGRSAHTTLAA